MQHVSDHFSYSQDMTWLGPKATYCWEASRPSGSPSRNRTPTRTTTCSSSTHAIAPSTARQHSPARTTSSCCTSSSRPSSLGPLASDSAAFLADVSTTLEALDKGLHISSWGGVQEWKLLASLGYDSENDTHRHLSNLWGWYLGISLSSPAPPFLSSFANATI